MAGPPGHRRRPGTGPNALSAETRAHIQVSIHREITGLQSAYIVSPINRELRSDAPVPKADAPTAGSLRVSAESTASPSRVESQDNGHTPRARISRPDNSNTRAQSGRARTNPCTRPASGNLLQVSRTQMRPPQTTPQPRGGARARSPRVSVRSVAVTRPRNPSQRPSRQTPRSANLPPRTQVGSAAGRNTVPDDDDDDDTRMSSPTESEVGDMSVGDEDDDDMRMPSPTESEVNAMSLGSSDSEILERVVDAQASGTTEVKPKTPVEPECTGTMTEDATPVGSTQDASAAQWLAEVSARVEQMEGRLLIFPTVGCHRVPITARDYSQLKPGNMLSDDIVEFGLRYWHVHQARADLSKHIHIFSPQFWTMLDRQGPAKVATHYRPEDVAKHRYIVVPINDSCHWYVVIICHPAGLFANQDKRVATVTRGNVMGVAASDDHGHMMENSDNTSVNLASASAPQWTVPGVHTVRRATVFVVLDSLGIQRIPRMDPAKGRKGPTLTRPSKDPTVVLEAWLRDMAMRTLNVSSSTEAARYQPKVPQQISGSNDCGMWVVHYVSGFLSDPHGFLAKIESAEGFGTTAAARAQVWQADHVPAMRGQLREIIAVMANEQCPM